MKRVIWNVLAGALMVAAFTACGNNDDNDVDDPKGIKIQNPDALNQTLYADETDGKSLTFTTLGGWIAHVTEKTPGKTGTPDWVKVDPKIGLVEDKYTMKISVTANDTNADRMAVITIQCGPEKVEINITQKATKK